MTALPKPETGEPVIGALAPPRSVSRLTVWPVPPFVPVPPVPPVVRVPPVPVDRRSPLPFGPVVRRSVVPAVPMPRLGTPESGSTTAGATAEPAFAPVRGWLTTAVSTGLRRVTMPPWFPFRGDDGQSVQPSSGAV